MSREYPSDWDKRRKKVYRRDRYECQNCGRGGESNNIELHAHHIVPKSKGGTHKMSNLISLCEKCHSAIHYNSDAPQPTNEYAPTQPQHGRGGLENYELFKQCVGGIRKIVDETEKQAAIVPPGQFERDPVERRRVSGIQDFGRLSISHSAPTKDGRELMERFVHKSTRFLRSPEDAWDKREAEDLNDKETIELVENMLESRFSECMEPVDELASWIESDRITDIFRIEIHLN